MELAFTKCEGAGNDFLVIEGSPKAHGLGSESRLRRFTQKHCDRHFGIGADGCVFLWPRRRGGRQVDQAWIWEFRNADGSRAEMCGNAARALTLWFQRRFPKEKEFLWEAKAGLIHGHLDTKQKAWLRWPGTAERLALNGLPSSKDFRLFAVRAGVPHAVGLREKPWTPEARSRWAARLRRHPSFGAGGANVTFVSSRARQAVTFERGVEAETLACGSGAIAAFLAEKSGAPKLSEARYGFPGGELLVKRDAIGALWLSGPASIVFQGKLVLV